MTRWALTQNLLINSYVLIKKCDVFLVKNGVSPSPGWSDDDTAAFCVFHMGNKALHSRLCYFPCKCQRSRIEHVRWKTRCNIWLRKWWKQEMNPPHNTHVPLNFFPVPPGLYRVTEEAETDSEKFGILCILLLYFFRRSPEVMGWIYRWITSLRVNWKY